LSPLLHLVENEPLVSLDTKFLLGTDMSTIPAITGTSSQFVEDANGQPAIQLELNQDAFSRYFDRPEVIKACRDLAHIQTPDFRQIPPNESLAGRFRVRANAEDVSAFRLTDRYAATDYSSH
jgi:hypothetical protein